MDSEFRQDIVSHDWVLIASGRGKRPHAPKPRAENYQKPENCPFEGFADPIHIIPNKFPAVTPGICEPAFERDGYRIAAGVGLHEVVIMRDHDRFFPDYTSEETADIITTYRDRYREIAKEQCGQYIMIFHNYGREGGASIYHPHSQIISVPIIPPDVARSLRGSYDYFKKHGTEAHAVMIEKELSAKTRVIFENDRFVAFCPYVSKQPYEIRIYPKFASGHFEKLEDLDTALLGEALQAVLKKVHTALGDPAFNFFIHTAPLHYEHSDVAFDKYYRWHIEIIPRVSFDAGFEAGTGIKINIMDPDAAAETLNHE